MHRVGKCSKVVAYLDRSCLVLCSLFPRFCLWCGVMKRTRHHRGGRRIDGQTADLEDFEPLKIIAAIDAAVSL